jgi:hypothetical protein
MNVADKPSIPPAMDVGDELMRWRSLTMAVTRVLVRWKAEGRARLYCTLYPTNDLRPTISPINQNKTPQKTQFVKKKRKRKRKSSGAKRTLKMPYASTPYALKRANSPLRTTSLRYPTERARAHSVHTAPGWRRVTWAAADVPRRRRV